MECNTKEERLKIYRKMLRDYRLSNLPVLGLIFKEIYNTYSGFCLYIWKNINSNYGIKMFVELYKLKPKNTFYYPFWFKEKDLKSRIELLKKAISDTKMYIEIEKLMLKE